MRSAVHSYELMRERKKSWKLQGLQGKLDFVSASMASSQSEQNSHYGDATVSFGRLVEEFRSLRRHFNAQIKIKSYDAKEAFRPRQIYQQEITTNLIMLARAFACKHDVAAAELVFREIEQHLRTVEGCELSVDQQEHLCYTQCIMDLLKY